MLPYLCYTATFGHSRSNLTSLIMDIVLKNLSPHMTTSRLSRSLKVTGTKTDRSATYDFLLVIYSNHGPVSYHFRDKRQFLSKIVHFPHSSAFSAPPREFPLEFCNSDSAQKLVTPPTRRWKESGNSFRQSVTDGETDERI